MTVALPVGTAEAYEALRPALLDSSGAHRAITGRVLLLRRGMVAWAHARDTTLVAPPAPRSLGAAARAPELSDVTAELVQLMAGLILHHHQEAGRCLN